MASPVLAAKLVMALGRLVHNPSRLDIVFGLTDSLSLDPAATADFASMLERPQIRRACMARQRTPRLDLAELDARPAGSLARTAADFFRANGLDPNALPRTEPRSDVDWLTGHLYETHDLWHVVTGFAPTVAGELGLQAFYATQASGMLPLAILTAGMINTLFFASDERNERLAAIARGWRMGSRARLLVGVDWAELLDRPIGEVRQTLGLDVSVDVISSHDTLAVAA